MNKSKGNMYDWITHTWNPLNGKCSHDCGYCYVKSMKRMDSIRRMYSGPARINEKVIKENLGKDNFIFVCNMSDIFAKNVSDYQIKQVIDATLNYPNNQYLIQTKNPGRALDWVPNTDNYVLCTTMECDVYPKYGISQAPSPKDRASSMMQFKGRKTVTIEPILQCQYHNYLIDMIVNIGPEWVSIGADSGNNNLPEPSTEMITTLIDELRLHDIKVIKKSNLERLLK